MCRVGFGQLDFDSDSKIRLFIIGHQILSLEKAQLKMEIILVTLAQIRDYQTIIAASMAAYIAWQFNKSKIILENNAFKRDLFLDLMNVMTG